MSDPDVRELFRQAVTHNDSAAMRKGIESLFGLTGDGLSPEAEHRLRHPDYVMEMPQSGERIRGRDAMRAMQEAFPVAVRAPLTIVDVSPPAINTQNRACLSIRSSFNDIHNTSHQNGIATTD